MKTESRKQSPVADDVLALFADIPTTEEITARMQKHTPAWEADPDFVSGYLKARFVEDIYAAMEAQGINKKRLADKLGKSRQYVGRVLNETANFTLESMAEIACALDMRVAVRLYTQQQRVAILPKLSRPAELTAFASFAALVKEPQFLPSETGEEDDRYFAA